MRIWTQVPLKHAWPFYYYCRRKGDKPYIKVKKWDQEAIIIIRE